MQEGRIQRRGYGAAVGRVVGDEPGEGVEGRGVDVDQEASNLLLEVGFSRASGRSLGRDSGCNCGDGRILEGVDSNARERSLP